MPIYTVLGRLWWIISEIFISGNGEWNDFTEMGEIVNISIFIAATHTPTHPHTHTSPVQ